MTRDEKLRALSEVLMLAAAKASALSCPRAAAEGLSREIALSKQIEGIAMEFKALAAVGSPTVSKKT